MGICPHGNLFNLSVTNTFANKRFNEGDSVVLVGWEGWFLPGVLLSPKAKTAVRGRRASNDRPAGSLAILDAEIT